MQWLWGTYIPFGKLTIIQGDPGEGKTTLALRLAAACSTGAPLPGMELMEPFNVIYQSAEDGMGDTIKPRLMEAGADLDRVLSIVEEKKQLSLLDERIEKAIREHNARLMILDPIQGYIGSRVDINRANEIRTVLKSVSSVAERTGCAIVLINHRTETRNGKAKPVPAEHWQRAQALLKQKARPAFENRAAHRYSGLLTCGNCGQPFVPMIRYWNGSRRVEYVCKGYHSHGKEFCSSHRIREECLNTQVVQYAESLRESWENEQAEQQRLYKQWSLRQPVLDWEIARLREEIRQTEDDIDELLMLRIQANK